MRGAFGKPFGKVARVDIGQVVLSVRTKDSFADHACESIRRATFKFPGRMKIFKSKKWGFTDFHRDEYLSLKAEGKLRNEGVHAKRIREAGPLGKVVV